MVGGASAGRLARCRRGAGNSILLDTEASRRPRSTSTNTRTCLASDAACGGPTAARRGDRNLMIDSHRQLEIIDIEPGRLARWFGCAAHLAEAGSALRTE